MTTCIGQSFLSVFLADTYQQLSGDLATLARALLLEVAELLLEIHPLDDRSQFVVAELSSFPESGFLAKPSCSRVILGVGDLLLGSANAPLHSFDAEVGEISCGTQTAALLRLGPREANNRSCRWVWRRLWWKGNLSSDHQARKIDTFRLVHRSSSSRRNRY